ncbi:MAG: CxxxxCH/CxxCH domain-containing protein [Geobacteraceae bacterium]|nr:CxxxxCH/CxxCH domain-containing protein [Geobacteraceae bacterium]
MNSNFARWSVSQILLIVMLVAAGSAFAAGDALIHNSNNLGTSKGVWGVTGGKYGQFTCTTCHNKSTNNVKRVADVVTAPLGNWSSSKATTVAVVFNNMTGFGTDAGGHTTSTKICQVCHTKTAYHRYNTTGQADLTHNNQADCTQCHSHAKAFAASCNTCHGYPPKNTTPGADGLVGGSNPQTYALGVTPASPGAHVKHDNANMKCTTCHSGFRNTTAHQRPAAQWGKLEMGFNASNANWAQFTGPTWTGGSATGSNALNTGYTWVGNGGTTVPTAATATVTCSVYCHGNWANSGGGANPSWINGSAEATCGACHGASAATPPPTNAHARHAQTLSATTLGLSCDKCHGTHADNSHVNGSVKWDVSGLATTYATSPKYKGFNNVSGVTGQTNANAPSVTFGSCSNVYCHSNVQGANGTGAPTSFAAVTWSSGSVACDSCHWATGGAFKMISSGSHRAHVSRGYTYNCNTCHNGAGSATALHADGKVQVSMASGTYSQAGKNAGAAAFGSCATVSCHASTTPTWGSTLAANCLGCHGDKTSATLSGAHNKHMNDATFGGSFNCIDCHGSVVSSNTVLSNKALHTNGLINYSGALSGKYAGVSPVTCATQYCHSNGKGTAAAPPAWTGSFTAGTTCYKCHGTSGTTGAPDNSTPNSHPKHAPLATDCWKCHFKTASKTAGQLATGTVDHLDKNIDARLAVPFVGLTNYSGSYSSAAKTCSATYCHGGTNPAATPAWGTAASTNCNSCHVTKPTGLSAGHAFHVMSTSTNYNYTQSAANNSTAAAYSFNCAACHGNTAAKHLNGPEFNGADATIQFLYSSAGRGAAASTTYNASRANAGTDARGFKYAVGANAACNNTYCHSNGKSTLGNGISASLNWGSATTGNCTACHDNDKVSTTLSGVHDNHLNKAATGGAFKCKDCHAQTISNADNRTLTDKSKHVNKIINYSGALAGKNKNCSNIYCHSNGRGTYANPVGGWTGAVIGCNGCHGTSGSTGAPDNVVNDSHAKHAPTSAQCFRCHFKTASTTVGQLVTGTIDHLDGNIDARLTKVSSFTTFSGVLNANKTCSATYCHGGSVTTPIWGTAGSTNCNSCHASKPNGLSAGHAFHIISTATNYNYGNVAANNSTSAAYNFNCAVCHGNTLSLHADGPRASGSDATIQFMYSSAGRGLTPTNTWNTPRTGTSAPDSRGFNFMVGANATCNATYCHSNGKSALGNGISATLTWSSATTGTCTACHGNASSANGVLSGAHFRHFSTTSFKTTSTRIGCKDCHAQTVSGTNLTITNKANHVNKLINYSGGMAGKNKTCNNIYCHSNGKGVYSNTTWATTNGTGCNFCHGSASAPLTSTYAHTKHLATAGINCSSCHSATTTTNSTITGTKHIDGTVDLQQGGTFLSRSVSFSYAGGGTCNNINCHAVLGAGASSATWGVRASCDTCHPKANLSGAHKTHMGALDLTSASIMYNMTANRSDQLVSATQHGFGCANCHPMTTASHLNGTVDVDLNRVNVAGVSKLRFLNHSTAGYVGGKCSNMYCHSNASRIEAESNVKSNTSLAWTDKFANYTGASAGVNRKDRCAQCHLNQPTTGAHAAHAVGNHSDNIYNGKSGKIAISSRANTAHGNANNSTTIGCYICHNGVVTSAANDKNTKCVGCHTIGNAYGAKLKGDATIANIALHVNGTGDIQFAQINIRSKAQIRPKLASNANKNGFDFYSGVWQRTSYKNMSTLSYDISKVRLDQATTYTYSTPMNSSCSNVVCHNGKSPTWNMADWNDPNKCMDCHNAL